MWFVAWQPDDEQCSRDREQRQRSDECRAEVDAEVLGAGLPVAEEIIAGHQAEGGADHLPGGGDRESGDRSDGQSEVLADERPTRGDGGEQQQSEQR